MNSVSSQFHDLATGSIRPLDWEVGVSWSKERSQELEWFTLDQSVLNGEDLLAENTENPIQIWDAYDYERSRDRVVSLSVNRSVEFPYNIQSATCDVTLNNYDHYYNLDNTSSPISSDILPARPLRAYLGFKGAGVTPVFVGLTEGIPTYSGTDNTTAQLTAMDFLATIGDMSLKSMVMMMNVRTDQVIAAILEQFGMEPYMFNLARGVNVIPFVYFESGKNAGNALKELVQAENGAMWIDEQGIVRFAPRTAIVGVQSSMTFNPSSIISITPSATSGIVNKVYVETNVRKVMPFQLIFSNDNSSGWESEADEDTYRLGANGDTEIWLSFDDPVWQCTANPILNGEDTNSSFTAVDLQGKAVNSGITGVGTLFATSLKIVFTNTNNFPVSINYIQIFGEPAKVVGGEPTITYTAQDDESIERFGVQELSITDNNCFGTVQNVDAFATDVLTRYAGYSPTLQLEVKGDPSLQLHDVITLDGTDYDGDYLIKGISNSLTDTGLSTTLTVVAHTVLMPFILDQSQLNGEDVLS